ncbi:hypothetical protein N665_0116s0084, partial [Sinapis alba]
FSYARIYKVGDPEGWTAKDNVYYAWSETEHKEFHVGDSLIFEYDPIINDVTQVSGSLEYKLCDYSSPKAVYNIGHDVVTLTEPGFHYFITSNQTQCVLGQKLDVLVIHEPSRLVPPPLPSKIIPVGKTYKVGDSEGWKVYDNDFYNKLSEDKQFHVEDTLLFEYATEVNDVGLKLRVVVGSLPKPVTNRNFPKKVDLSAMERLNNWLQTFKPQPHH